jgi:hypothetical protein
MERESANWMPQPAGIQILQLSGLGHLLDIADNIQVDSRNEILHFIFFLQIKYRSRSN